jgi:epoxide hydrolase-like predicted phosphatase
MEIKDADLFKTVWEKNFKKAARLDKGVVKIIKWMDKEGYRVVTLSNTIPAHVKWHKKLGHYKFFEKLFLSCNLGMKKPDARIYKYTVRKLGVKSAECVFIDDKKRNVISARRTGMKAILFKNSTQLKKELKRYL